MHMGEGKASAEVFWAPGKREGGALSNRDLYVLVRKLPEAQEGKT